MDAIRKLREYFLNYNTHLEISPDTDKHSAESSNASTSAISANSSSLAKLLNSAKGEEEYDRQYATETHHQDIRPIITGNTLPENSRQIKAGDFCRFHNQSLKTLLSESFDEDDFLVYFLINSGPETFAAEIHSIMQARESMGAALPRFIPNIVDSIVLFSMALGSYAKENTLYVPEKMGGYIKNHHSDINYFKTEYACWFDNLLQVPGCDFDDENLSAVFESLKL